MMPLYTMGSLRGGHNSLPMMSGLDIADMMEPGSEDSDDDSDDGYDSVHTPSEPGPADELYRLHIAPGELSEDLNEDYGEYLHDALVQQAHSVTSELSDSGGSEGEARSGASSPSRLATPPSHVASRLMDIGIFDLEFSTPDFGGDDHTDDSHETDSDGELTINPDDDEEELDDEFDDVPNPPQLPTVTEERLQEVWPLGDQSFSIFICPITHDVMTDPVVSADGYTYERSAIARWFETSRKSPVTGQALPHTDLVANHSVRTLLKMLIDMTEGSTKAPRVQSDIAAESSTAAGSSSATSSVKALPAPPTTLPAERQREKARRDSEQSPHSNQGADVRHMEAATMAAVSSSLPSDSPASTAASAAALERGRQDSWETASATALALRQQERAQRASDERTLHNHRALRAAEERFLDTGVLLNSLSTSPQPQHAAASGSAQPSRPSSQPQPATTSGGLRDSQQRPQSEQRPLSSAPCHQQRPQAPSTALPPLRPGTTPPRSSQTPPMPAEPSGRGSPPLMVPSLARLSGPPTGRVPSQPPFSQPPVPSEGTSSQSSNSSVGHRHEFDNFHIASLSHGEFDGRWSPRPAGHHKRSNSTAGVEQR